MNRLISILVLLIGLVLFLATSTRAQIPVLADFRVDSVDRTSTFHSPAIESFTNGDFAVVFHDMPSIPGANIYFRKYSGNGTPITSDIEIDDSSANAAIPRIAINNLDEVFVAWLDERLGGGGTPLY